MLKILCVMGQYQYGDPSRGLGTEYSSFVPALKSLGHQINHFESWQRDCYKDFSDLNRRLLETIEVEKPDIMLVVQMGYEIWLETLDYINENTNVATVCWTTDDSWKYKEFSRFIGKHYNTMTTTYPEILSKYHSDGIHNVLLTQWAANTDFLNEPLPGAQCKYPVTFVGAAHGHRQRMIKELGRRGLEVQCFGYGWPNGPVDTETMYKIVRESIISLNFSNSRGANQIKARTFEVPGSGGFLLTEYVPNLEQFYSIDKEIAVFCNLDELVSKAKYYLSHPEARDKIARTGFERTKLSHTYDIRMKEVIECAFHAKESHRSLSEKTIGYTDWFDMVRKTHKKNALTNFIARCLIEICSLIWGKERGPRAARRLTYELSWRISGAKTYSAAGWPGRLFYGQS